MRVQGTMASGTGGPVHKPDRGSLPLARQIGLGPHVAGFRPPPGGVGRPGDAPFADTPVRTLTPLRSDMGEEAQTAIIAQFTKLWSRASPNGCDDDVFYLFLQKQKIDLRWSLCAGGTLALDR